jgi:hypothetical protein
MRLISWTLQSGSEQVQYIYIYVNCKPCSQGYYILRTAHKKKSASVHQLMSPVNLSSTAQVIYDLALLKAYSLKISLEKYSQKLYFWTNVFSICFASGVPPHNEAFLTSYRKSTKNPGVRVLGGPGPEKEKMTCHVTATLV